MKTGSSLTGRFGSVRHARAPRWWAALCLGALVGCVGANGGGALDESPAPEERSEVAAALSSARSLAAPEAAWTAALSGSRWTLGEHGLEGPGAVGVDDAANVAAASAASFARMAGPDAAGEAEPGGGPETAAPVAAAGAPDFALPGSAGVPDVALGPVLPAIPGLAGLDDAARPTLPALGGPAEPSAPAPAPLYARLSPSAGGPVVIGAGPAVDARLPVTLEGLAAVPYELVGGVAVAREALPATDVLVTTDGAELEVFYRLADASAPTEWRWTLGASPRFTARQEGEAVVLADGLGEANLRITAPGAIDAAGTRYTVTATLDGQTVRFALAVPEGARVAYPVLVDPIVEVFTWRLALADPNPSAREAHALAYDASRSEVVLFGGIGSGDLLSDTWTWNGATSTWTNRTPPTSPPARFYHALAYDASRSEVVLFGGAGPDLLADTWTWNGASSTWTNRTPTTSPPARFYHALAYDASRSEVVLFGGQGSSGNLSDTWTWNGATSTWTNRTPTASPSARVRHGLAYDASRSEVVLFGGGGGLSDTWTWNGASSTWTNRTPTTSPPNRDYIALAYDASRSEVVLFGGVGSSGYLSDTWTWNGATSTWTNRTSTASPPGRRLHALAYDASRSQVVLFGGLGSSGYLSDTWTWNGAASTWTNRTPTTAPPARGLHALAYDASRSEVVLFGGYASSGDTLSDTWTWNGATSTCEAVLLLVVLLVTGV